MFFGHMTIVFKYIHAFYIHLNERNLYVKRSAEMMTHYTNLSPKLKS